MSGITGSAELKKENIRIFGPALGPVYHELYNEVVWLYAKWLEYRKLYAVSEEQIGVLNETASFFFYTIETVLREDILLHIARLTDHTGKRQSKRLSLLLLPKLVTDPKLAGVLQKLLEDTLQRCDFARYWRNRQIAHSNYSLAINPDEKAKSLPDVSRQQIGEVLASIKEVINKVSKAYSGNPTGFELFHSISGADTLVFYLEEAIKFHKHKMNRLRNGKALPEDLE